MSDAVLFRFYDSAAITFLLIPCQSLPQRFLPHRHRPHLIEAGSVFCPVQRMLYTGEYHVAIGLAQPGIPESLYDCMTAANAANESVE